MDGAVKVFLPFAGVALFAAGVAGKLREAAVVAGGSVGAKVTDRLVWASSRPRIVLAMAVFLPAAPS